MIEEKLPDIFRRHAFHPTHFVYAWRKGTLEKLLDELLKSNIAIVSGQAWLVEDGEEITHLIPLNSGELKVFNWEVEKIKEDKEEEWYDFVERSIKESIALINSWNLEKTSRVDLSNKIWYNFTFAEKTA